MGWWRKGALLAFVVFGLLLGRGGEGLQAYTPGMVRPVVKTQEQINQELLEAVRKSLDGKVQPQDMPRRVIKAERIGSERYRVHMAMVQGEGWFEVWLQGGQWQVKGINPPQ